MKTRVLRVRQGEVFFKHAGKDEEGDKWEIFHKDLSAIIKADRARKFKSVGITRNPLLVVDSESGYLPSARAIPCGYWTDLIGDYSAHEYADGHKPLSDLRLW